MSRTADVVIIGGGVTGASTAFHLAGRGVRDVVVLERRFLAAGGTGRSVGIVRQLYPTRETTEMVVRSLRVFQHFADTVGGTASFVACGVLIAVPPSMRTTLERTLVRQREIGVRAQLLEPGEVRHIESRIDTGSAGAVVWEPDSGYGDPSAVTAAYAAAARERGAHIEQGAEVVGIDVRGDRITGVTTAAGDRIDTPIVVNAAGLWAPAVSRLAGVDLPIVVGRHPVFVVERPPDFGGPHPVYLDLAGGSYVRPESGGLTLTGSLTDDEARHPMDPENLGADVGLDEAAEALERTGRAMPPLAESSYRRGWAGAFDITPDWMPILDGTSITGYYVAAGMSGHGFKLAPAVGEIMAALVTGGEPPVGTTPFRLARFDTARREGTFVASYLVSGDPE